MSHVCVCVYVYVYNQWPSDGIPEVTVANSLDRIAQRLIALIRGWHRIIVYF